MYKYTVFHAVTYIFDLNVQQVLIKHIFIYLPIGKGKGLLQKGASSL